MGLPVRILGEIQERMAMGAKDEFVREGTVSDTATLDGIRGEDIYLLDAVDLPIIVLNGDCVITRINRAATTVLGLQATDVGRAVKDSLPNVENLDKICTRVIADGAAHRMEARDGDRSYLLRIAPYTAKDRRVAGSVLAFTNITAFRASIDQAIYEREYTKAILNTVVDPLLVLDTKLQVQTANRAFYSLFGLSRNETNGVSIRNLGNSDWQNSEAWKSIEATLILSDDAQFQAVEIDCEFPSIGRRTIALNARRLPGDGKVLLLLTLQDVTERKKAERTNSLLAAIVGSSDDAIISKKLDGTITSWNNSAQRLFGYTAEEAIGQRITLIVPWERRSEEEEILRRLARGERVDHFETVRRSKEGKLLEVSLTISPIRDVNGEVIGASNVARDVTEKKRVERALEKSEERFRIQLKEDAAALAKLNELSLRLWRCLTMEEGLNEILVAAIELLGADKGNIQLLDQKRGVLTISVQRGFQQEFLDFFREVSTTDDSACGRALRSGQRIVIEDVEQDPPYAPMCSIARTAGYRSVVSAPLISADGEPLGMISTHFPSPHRPTDQELHRLDLYVRQAADYILRCKADEALHQSEERFRALVTASSDVVYRMNSDWSEMHHLDGRGFIADTGKPRKDWLDEYIHPDDQLVVLRTIREAVRTKSMFELEHRVRRTDGTLGWTYSRAVPLLDANGEIVEWFGAASDVTDRREAEEKYRKLAQTLDGEVRARTRAMEEQSSQVRDLSRRLLRSQDEERRHIARELHDSAGQTLTVLGISLAQLAQKAGRNAPEIASEAEQIQETVQQLHREIRTTSYLLHPPLLDENGLYSAVSWYVQGLQERSGLRIDLDIPKDFGRLPGEMELVLFRLVQECLTNIHRHSESKTAAIRIARESNQVTLDIRDEGKGMSGVRLAEIQAGLSGVGIRGMRERLSQFEGKMNIESDSSGTKVLAIIPTPKVTSPEDNGNVDPVQAAV
jgi:PAS domain S-box-containing protein